MLAWSWESNSVRLSVYHTRALWLIQRVYRRYFYTTWKGNPSSQMWFFVQLRSSWQNFNWRKASRGPSAIAELLVTDASIIVHEKPWTIHHYILLPFTYATYQHNYVLQKTTRLQKAHISLSLLLYCLQEELDNCWDGWPWLKSTPEFKTGKK